MRRWPWWSRCARWPRAPGWLAGTRGPGPWRRRRMRPATAPPEATPRDLSAGLYEPAPEHPQVMLRLGRWARWVADYYPCEKVRELADGQTEVTLRVAETDWVRRLALRLGTGAEVIAPPSL